MKKKQNIGAWDIPLQFARQLSGIVSTEWERCVEQFSPVTQDLLRYWFDRVFCDNRSINFHAGQKRAILNTIYCHEILKVQNVLDMYQKVSEGLLNEKFKRCIAADKYSHPKYCIKMATGTGKTWCMNALFLWQYLNAKFGAQDSRCLYTKNFLFVAPGLIVYERLLDSFLGKANSGGIRDFSDSDLKKNEKLFIPEKYREAVYGFVQNSTVGKDDIGRKTTGEGVIAITNWHVLNDESADDTGVDTGQDSPKAILKDILPIRPGTTAGHTLDTLDGRYFRGDILEYLKGLSSICVFNDEAHHIHENNVDGVVKEVEWQKALDSISVGKNSSFLQVDFSATPYDVAGAGQNRTKHYFPHITVDFGLDEAIKSGLVKMIAIDRRKQIESIENQDLDFSAVRDGKEVIALSDGQRFMLRAGLKKLHLLDTEFIKLNPNRHPKMLVVCEDTRVSPHVIRFLQDEGLGEEDVLQIDSDGKNQVGDKEWKNIKQRLFHIDQQKSPQVIVSVLMLREGFDVNNICVIVPLRSSQAPILLEQVIGRGLRLMWREEPYKEICTEIRQRMLKKQEPNGQFDILHIVEHPAYIKFYDDLNEDIVYEEHEELTSRKVLGDLIKVGLKENYGDYDFYIPKILREREEYLTSTSVDTQHFEKFRWGIDQLKLMVRAGGEIMVSEDILVKTRFGEFKVHADILSAKSYNEYLAKIVNAVSQNMRPASLRQRRYYPVMQIHQTELVGLIDNYIREDLFGEPFDPLDGDSWKILMAGKVPIMQHILSQVSIAVEELQKSVDIEDAQVEKQYFSSVSSICMRENYSLHIAKSIYERTSYPSNKGKYEKAFMLYADADGAVERLMKIDTRYHDFAGLRYIRTDGHFATYYPDFLVKIGNDIYVVETKAQNDIRREDVVQKQRGAMDWIERINRLQASERMNATWHYVILGDEDFYEWREKDASIYDMMNYSVLSSSRIEGKLL